MNYDFVAYFDEELPFRQAAEIADAHLAGMYEIEYQLIAPEPGGIHDPDWLAQVDAFTAWLRAQPETAHVLSWTDVLERLHRVMSDGGAEAGRLPPDAPTASQYTLLYELSLPLGLDLTNLIAQDYGSVRQLVTLRNMDSRRVLEFEQRADAWLAEHAPDVAQRHGGINLMFAHVSERNVAAMFEGNLLAVAVIALVLAAALRSLTLAAVSLVTNLVPVLGAFAIWGWLVGSGPGPVDRLRHDPGHRGRRHGASAVPLPALPGRRNAPGGGGAGGGHERRAGAGDHHRHPAARVRLPGRVQLRHQRSARPHHHAHHRSGAGVRPAPAARPARRAPVG
ncbi:MAG: hypothetical protein U5R48_02630 [Gammaproteobacteria bacterium]|nr:hypothetical protein [Gammaproteobacteria bacterium]